MASPSSGTGVLCPAAANAASFRARQLLLPVVVALVALTRPRPTLGGFREDEHTATVFNASGALPYHHDAAVGKAAVAGLLAALGDRMMTNGGRCSSVGAGTTTVPGGGLIHGLMRCAAGIPCSDCRRCLLRATEVAEREYNGSAGMQVLRLSCMARYESYPFYNATAMWMQGFSMASGQANTTVRRHRSNFTLAAHPAPAPRLSPGPPRSPPAQMQVTRPNHQSWTRKRLVTFIAPIAVGSVIVLAILGLVMFHRKPPLVTKHVEDGMLGENICYQGLEHITSTEEDEDAEEMSYQCYTYQVLESATCHFTNSNKLGSGGFGTVYKGMLGNGKEVAVKRLKDSKRDLKELEKEISIMANLRHKNLLRLIGYCFEEERRLLVYEYVPNNSLEKFWHKAHLESQKLHWATWFNIIKGVAHGLQYLHGQGILHRDLKPHNVLLDENLNPKIADFDLMRVYDKEKTHESTEKVAGTFGYMAPECTLGRKLQLSIKSDVYSYGVLVLEIITGHKINTFEGENFEGLVEYVWQHWTEKKASDVVDGDLVCVEGSEHERRQAERCVHMALLCVQSDRSRRPTMDLVIAILRNEAIVLPEPSLPGYIDRKSEPAVRRYLPCLS